MDFPIKSKRKKDGTYSYAHEGRCNACKKARQREQYADPEFAAAKRAQVKAYRETPEGQATRRAYRQRPEVQERNRKRYREIHGQPAEQRKLSLDQKNKRRREWWAFKRATDPEWYERQKEYNRIYQEAKRREKGIKPQKLAIASRETLSTKADPQLPREPFVEWIMDRRDAYGGLVGLAEACGTSERRLRVLIQGVEHVKNKGPVDVTHVRLGYVDDCLVREGTTDLWEVYPHLYEDDVDLLEAA